MDGNVTQHGKLSIATKKKRKKADEFAATVLYQAENDITCCAL